MVVYLCVWIENRELRRFEDFLSFYISPPPENEMLRTSDVVVTHRLITWPTVTEYLHLLLSHFLVYSVS